MAHWAGLSVSALIALMNAVAAMVSANWRYSWPVMPPRNAVGRNTAISTSVIAMTGPVTSVMAWIVASRGASPLSMWCDAFSTMTMASSTTMPIARTRPNSVSRLIEKPRNGMNANAPMIVTGTVVAGTSSARQLWRKTRITMSTRTPASARVL